LPVESTLVRSREEQVTESQRNSPPASTAFILKTHQHLVY
jgi:hypothetical protein